jgi:hypothetical protein
VKFLLDHDVPDDLSYLLEQLGHDVKLLRKALPGDSSDEAVLQFAHERGCVLLTCNRDDFLATTRPHHGIIIVIRRRTRADERAALFRLLERAGETGLRKQRQLRIIDGDASAESRTLRFEELRSGSPSRIRTCKPSVNSQLQNDSKAYARISRTTFPKTSVSRKSLPA